MNAANDIEPVVVFSGTAWQAEMVKSLLEDAEINAYLMDEYTGTLAPWYTYGGGAGAVKVSVSSEDVEKAVTVVEHYQQNLREE